MACVNYDDVNIKNEFEKFFNKKSIGEQCTKESLTRLYKQFLITKNEEMDISQLKNAFVSILNIKLTSEDFDILFRRINLTNDGYVTWNQFISYLIMEFQKVDVSIQHQMLELPLTGSPEILRTRHRTPICRIAFYPELLPDRSRSFQRGCYLTVSRDGVINYWSLDFKYERSVQSTNPFLKIQQTIITDMILMPDVQIVCVSSTERDLRFYDVVAKKFELRVMISSLDHVVVCMSYYFSSRVNEDSYIILGDKSGSIIIMTFSSIEKGPFKQQPEYNTLFIRYEAITRGELPDLKVIEIKHVHNNWVNQVAYYGSLRAFMSSSRCSECSLLFSDPTRIRIQYKFSLERGISCFNFCEENQMLVTGGHDCIIRIWNPFVPKKASNTFQGHKATICAIIIQNVSQRIYSLSQDRCIKVWHVPTQTCIQTYNGLQNELSENIKVSVIYNDLTHKMIIGGMVIAIVVCEQVINQETSDGITHTKPVSSVLYNHLYKVIVSTGLDSCIIVWDPWRGRRLYLVTHAHSILLYGQYVNIEITAATFDDSEHLLITGARNGSLKIWNFNTGTCLRNMAIEDQCEITSLSWVENRVLCTGWNRRVTEFTISELDTYKKSWELIHTDDILFSAVRYPQVLTTVSYNGEIIFWQLETGQPYRRYQVSNPTGRYAIKYKNNLKENKESLNEEYFNKNQSKNHIDICSHQESAINKTRSVTVSAIIYLNSRPINSNIGTLLISLESGIIQVWSHHPAGGFLTGFSVIHTRRDSAISLATDPENNYLITGHCLGYIKVWYIANYMIPNPPKLCMPLLRLEFPFLWRDKINGRAKRAVRDQSLPLLLSSHRGHKKPITCLQIIPNARIIISGSTDHTVRLWTLGGRYISTLGTFREWMPILPNIPAYKYFQHFRYPVDIKRSASSTTMKVLQGGLGSVEAKDVDETDYLKEIPEEGRLILYGIQLQSPILGNYLKVSDKTKRYIEPIILDNSLTHIPVYTHLTTHDLNYVESKLSLIVHDKKELH
ncbi:WD repeat-containing protein on Y chromosome [Polistes fuscatus]|uniref:WD repeat-containing protein on Y chromosome n=1 Tax=Polistes fuscatus TaxID=30207 RepID=UPI001CAA3DB2|nr:WD repeat-containing protein on Y chromosome [Polistes fuscatus]